MKSETESILDVVGKLMRERFEKIEREVRRADRALVLIRTVETLRIDISLAALRTWVRVVVHEKSRLIEARYSSPPWLAGLDSERAP